MFQAQERIALSRDGKPSRHYSASSVRPTLGSKVLALALKDRGFNFENTHLMHPKRLYVLLVVLSLALIWCCQSSEKAAHEVELRLVVLALGGIPCQSGDQAAHEVEIKVLSHGRPEKSVFRHGLDAIQKAVKCFGDGRLELLDAISTRCLSRKSRVLPILDMF